MKEAKRRNPDIVLWGLPWAFPGWVDSSAKNNPYSNVTKTAQYVVDWIDGARREHGLEIAMVGCWNERPWNADYLKELRRQLDARNFSRTGIIADDGHSSGTLATAMQKDPVLMRSVQAFGQHYPSMSSPTSATALGKPIYASEDYGVYFDSSGGKAWARLINQNFVRGGIVGTIAWNLVTSYYAPHPSASYGPCPSCNAALPFRLCGLMHAAWPWSGHYVPTPQLYVSAHTTQFVHVGDRYLSVGNGSGLLASGGSFVTFVRPAPPEAVVGPDLTVVIEKMSHQGSTSAWAALPAYDTAAENLTLHFGAEFAGRELALWKSLVPTAIVAAGKDGGIPSVDQMFLKQAGPFHVDENGSFTLPICVDCLFTLTTLLHAGYKGEFAKAPPPGDFPLPFSDNFDAVPPGQEADFFIDQAGSWEAVHSPSAGSVNSRGIVMRQMVEQKPVAWAGDQAPITILGSCNWTNVTVSVDVLLEASTHGMPWVGARIVGRVGDPAPAGPQDAMLPLPVLGDDSATCDATTFPHVTQRQYLGLTQGAASLKTEARCRQACCAAGQQHCTLYQFFPTEPSGSQCWYGLPAQAADRPVHQQFVSRSKLPLPVNPPPPPPRHSWGKTFTDAAGVILGIDSATATWRLAPCHLCLHVNSTLLAQGALPTGVLEQLAPWLVAAGSRGGEGEEWAKLRLVLVGAQASGFVGSHELFTGVDVSAVAPSKGYVGFGMGNFTAALFDSFAVAHSEQPALQGHNSRS